MLRKHGLIAALASLSLAFIACERSESPVTDNAPGPQRQDRSPSEQDIGAGRAAAPEEVKQLLAMPVKEPANTPAAASGALAKSAAVPLPGCTIGFNNSNSLSYVVDHGYSTFIYAPGYAEPCYGSYYWVRAEAINLDHFHLGAENPNQCYGTSPKWGTWGANGACVNQTDAMYWARRASNMNGNSGIVFHGVYQDGSYRNMDLKAIYVKYGSIKVLAYRVGVGWWYWPNLNADQRWYWTGNNTNISEVRVFDTNENGVFTIDNLEVALYP